MRACSPVSLLILVVRDQNRDVYDVICVQESFCNVILKPLYGIKLREISANLTGYQTYDAAAFTSSNIALHRRKLVSEHIKIFLPIKGIWTKLAARCQIHLSQETWVVVYPSPPQSADCPYKQQNKLNLILVKLSWS